MGNKVKVVLRARPSAHFASNNISISDDDQTLQLFLNKQDGQSKNLQEHYQFKFEHLLHNATQELTYQVCAQEIVGSVIQGYNGTVMAYGQTGAGKTYTMSGKSNAFPQRGITPRAITEVFQRLTAEARSLVTVRVSYVEIYNETFYDLLNPAADPSHIAVVEDGKGAIHVRGVEMRQVAGEADALGALFEGETARAIAQHQMNKNSSRSHALFTMYLESRSHPESDDVVVSKLHLVDLAGSERVLKTGSTGKVLKEATHINKSLTFLEQVIVALSEKNRDHVPYRSSKLTHVLKDSLGGNCKTLLIANIWGELAQLEETLSTCRFAQRMARVSNEATLNVKKDSVQLIKKYEREINELKQELAMHNQFASRSSVTYAPYSEAQRETLRGQVISYFGHSEPEHSIEPLEVLSVRHMKEILVTCKALYNERGYLATAAPPGAGQSRPPSAQSASLPSGAMAVANPHTSTATAHMPPGEEADYVGDLEDEGAAHGIPAAPEELQDAFYTSQSHPPSARPASAASDAPSAPAAQRGSQGAAPPKRPAPASTEEALQEFKGSAGCELSEALVENKRSLRAAKQKQKEVALRINGVKKEIDALKERVDNVRVEDGAEMDAEDYEALVALKALKAGYRDHYGELQMVKSEVEYTTRLVTACTEEMTAAFKAWYAEQFGAAAGDTPMETTSASAIAASSFPSGLSKVPSTAGSATSIQAAPAKQAPPASSISSASERKSQSAAESAFYQAQSRGSPTGSGKGERSTGLARARAPGTFGSGPKFSSTSKTNMDIDRGRK
eukprot:jgi/Tetstr1/444887/TSEL_032725.t1